MSAIPRAKTLVALSFLVPTLVASGCATDRPVTIATVVSCPQNSAPTASCGARQPRPATICVVFDANGCVESQMVGNKRTPNVRPYDQHACPDDDIEWIAVRGTSGNYTASNDKFKVLFMPMSRFFGLSLVGENADRTHSRDIYQNAHHGAGYNYTIVGGAQACPYKVFDPRIKIDPA